MSWVVRLIPSEKQTWTTDASIAEVMRRVEAEVDSGSWEGKVFSDSSFCLRRVQKIRASMVAVVKGRVLLRDGATHINVVITTRKFDKALWIAVYIHSVLFIVLTIVLTFAISPVFVVATVGGLVAYSAFCLFRMLERKVALQMLHRISASSEVMGSDVGD